MLLYSFGNRIDDLLEENTDIPRNIKVACIINGELRYLEDDYFVASMIDGKLKYLEEGTDNEKPYYVYFTASHSDKQTKKSKKTSFVTLGKLLDTIRWNCNCCSYNREKNGLYGDCDDNNCAMLVSNLNSNIKNYENEVIYYVHKIRYDDDLNVAMLDLTTEETF